MTELVFVLDRSGSMAGPAQILREWLFQKMRQIGKLPLQSLYQ